MKKGILGLHQALATSQDLLVQADSLMVQVVGLVQGQLALAQSLVTQQVVTMAGVKGAQAKLHQDLETRKPLEVVVLGKKVVVVEEGLEVAVEVVLGVDLGEVDLEALGTAVMTEEALEVVVEAVMVAGLGNQADLEVVAVALVVSNVNNKSNGDYCIDIIVNMTTLSKLLYLT